MEYYLLTNHDAEEFIKSVNDALQKDWLLHGDTFVCSSSGRLYQALVRRDNAGSNKSQEIK